MLQIGAELGEKIKSEARVFPKPINTSNSLVCITSKHSTTISVRGATLARPNGYCLCRDADIQIPENDLNETMKQLNLSFAEHRKESYRIRKLKRNIRKQQNIRLARMKGYLPRIVMSTPAKNPTLQGPNGTAKGRRQRSMQFLNADGSRAVFVRTPPFDCGPVKGPVTIFCVGIATEDGCFLSGLDRRFELGHLHAANKLDAEIDMSPICLAIDEAGESSLHSSKNLSQNEDSFFYSNYDSDSSHEEEESYCRCQFKFQDPEKSDEGNEYYPEAQERNILRGKVGPGRWHCYTAKIDGRNSLLRVDGVDEPNGENSYPFSNPVLDGLTIGADHCFDMTLCFGEGSDGEGEGSIAELAVFRGSMSKYDIETMEEYLMAKHGVPHGSIGYQKNVENSSVHKELKGTIAADQWEEDKWRRDAHALMSHPPPYQVSNQSIPLRIAANHKSVAWYRTNEVTGKKIRVSRIGSKLSTGSSDW